MESFTSKINKKTIFNIILSIIFLGIIFYISGIIGVLNSMLSFIFYLFFSYLIYIIWKNIRKKEYLSFDKFINFFLYRVLILIYFSVFIMGGLSYYSNKISPASMPTYTISNGDKTIIFQAMSHIGSKNFYEKIKQNLIKAKKEGYVYYFEGVRDGTIENKEKFNKAMGIKFDKDLYKNLSKLYGVINQDNSIYYNLVNNLDYNVDLSIDEIMQYYDELLKNNKSRDNSLVNSTEVIDVNGEIIKSLSQLNEKKLQILRYINKAILNFIIGSEKTQTFISDNFTNKKLFKIILDKRNEILSEKIINSKDTKIYITYGLLHFKGVFKILKEEDNNWKIIKTDYLYPIN